LRVLVHRSSPLAALAGRHARLWHSDITPADSPFGKFRQAARAEKGHAREDPSWYGLTGSAERPLARPRKPLTAHPGESIMFKHILVPTDGSQLSNDTVARAVQFAKGAGARITFFFAKPDYPVSFYGEGAIMDPTSPEKFAELAENQAREILDAAAKSAQAAGVQCATVSVVNDMPYEAIIAEAQARGCDLIFMASHGRRGISAMLLGSETQKVLTHSRVPVLVYR
jgi:nucleotide-binding universal stress UspA family protein